MIFNFLIVLIVFLIMEAVAFYTHKYVMHGFLWNLHESHHRPREGMFEKNDWFAVLFAIPSILCIYSGYHNDTALLWVGVGIASYCPAYFIFHDIIVHRRIKIKYKFKSRYMKRMIRAHQLHHSTSEKDYASSFGFLYVPKDLKLGV